MDSGNTVTAKTGISAVVITTDWMDAFGTRFPFRSMGDTIHLRSCCSVFDEVVEDKVILQSVV